MALDLGAIKAMLMDPKGLRPQPARAALEQIVARVEELEAAMHLVCLDCRTRRSWDTCHDPDCPLFPYRGGE